MSERDDAMRRWLTEVLAGADFALTPASSDASFRRYWRVRLDQGTRILMDAPPEREDCGRYADLAWRLRAIGLNTPAIQAEDRARGFLLLEDLGSVHYLDALDADNADALYADALNAIAILQARGPLDGLPLYDAPFIYRELDLFRHWFLHAWLGLAIDAELRATLDSVFDLLAANALEQPQVCVHRDFHSRNLMLTEFVNPGILDFQDAVVGPLSYDPVSLLRDCYIAWPAERVSGWMRRYMDLARQHKLLRDDEVERFPRWFDLMGIQRHLKACGIFARLHLRDDKPHYLADIPRTLGHIVEAARGYPELAGLSWLLQEQVLNREPVIRSQARAADS